MEKLEQYLQEMENGYLKESMLDRLNTVRNSTKVTKALHTLLLEQANMQFIGHSPEATTNEINWNSNSFYYKNPSGDISSIQCTPDAIVQFNFNTNTLQFSPSEYQDESNLQTTLRRQIPSIFNVGGQDVAPHPSMGFQPRHHQPYPGNEVGPDHPMFHLAPRNYPGVPPGRVPGARFDPIDPFSAQGIQEPNPDHLRMPSDSQDPPFMF